MLRSIKVKESELFFREAIKNNGLEIDEAYPLQLFSIVLKFFEEVRATDALDLNNKDFGDALLFQFGSYTSLSEPEKNHFYIDLTRQFITVEDSDDDAMYQLECTLTFDLTPDLESIDDFNKWCGSLDEFNEFKEFVLSNKAFSFIQNRKPKEIFIGLGEV